MISDILTLSLTAEQCLIVIDQQYFHISLNDGALSYGHTFQVKMRRLRSDRRDIGTQGHYICRESYKTGAQRCRFDVVRKAPKSFKLGKALFVDSCFSRTVIMKEVVIPGVWLIAQGITGTKLNNCGNRTPAAPTSLSAAPPWSQQPCCCSLSWWKAMWPRERFTSCVCRRPSSAPCC